LLSASPLFRLLATTPPLEGVLGAAAGGPELRTSAALAEEPIAEEPTAEAQRIAAASGTAEPWFEGEHLQPALIMGVAVVTTAAATAIRTINIAAEAATTVAEFILAALR